MDINLTIYDMDNFLDKYTRFMTKDIYISQKMHFNFLKQYDYLYQTLKKDRFLYNDNKQYKKVMNIIEDKDGLIKLHNQKYLKGALKKYQTFFNEILSKEELDNRKKSIILTEEDSLYVIETKNQTSLLTGKIKYLIYCQKIKADNILILVDNDSKLKSIKEKINDINVKVDTLRNYGNSLLNKEQVLDDNKKFDILIDYIINNLFLDKAKFNDFYKIFSKYIYLNKDYCEYETFKDYHNYMYKRKYLSSGFSLKKFNKEEIRKRKSYLRTIKNEVLKQNEEVDIANFLFLNSIPYIYDNEKYIFKIKLDEKENYIKFVNEKENLENKKNYLDNIIYLYSSYTDNKNFLEVLAYELIKRRYPLELIDDNKLYTKLKNTNIDNYFSEFIYKYLIPLINYYEENGSLSNINVNNSIIKEFLNIYNEYKKYIDKYNFISKKDWLKKIENKINNSKYKYLFLVGDVPLKCDIPTFVMVSDYHQETDLLKENIKLLYDYKNYLYNNQKIPIINTYISNEELKSLTKNFLEKNLSIVDKFLKETTKKIKIFEYNDNNRLHVYKNISNCCSNILKEHNKTSLLGFKHLKDINIIMNGDEFKKIDKHTLLFENKSKIKVSEILKIDKIYDTIILPYLVLDNYHEELFEDDYRYNIKVMLYIALNKCREELIILCPSSKKKEINKLI